ncbi:tail fiber protein [Synechococcus phage S-T4]|uniref:Tail fiber protein n=1 Tax=Synechococcus phage S-T4 TaxID=2268578 RepID=A0A385EF08_9CAUD|nr:tail fiber protein [Synechococcus phage S-T4]AXQ70464.1 hypothetical protein [Synechococcus phage S-T4]
MSTLKVNKIENTATTNGGVQIDVDGHVTIDGQQLPTVGPLSNRNMIINGAMQVAQRSANIDFSANAQYPACDRWKTSIDLASGVTNLNFLQDSDAPSGFANSYKISPNQAASGALSAADRIWIEHLIEGQNLQHLAYGTADAKTCILSFWLKSNLTGKVGIEIIIPGLQSYHASFTVNTADTWEFKTITINPNTTDTLVNTNAVGVSISWQFAAGPVFTGGSRTENSWKTVANNDERAPSDNINLYSSASNYVSLTGVQLEVGSKSTPFEHRSYGEELALCERYCQSFNGRIAIGNWNGGTGALVTRFLSPPMRTTPTMHSYTAGNCLVEAVNWYSVGSVAIQGESTNSSVTFQLSSITNSGQSFNANATWGNGAAAVIQAEL